MLIREATLEDFPAIDEFDVFARDRKVEIKNHEIIIAIVDDKVAGYLTHNRSFYNRPFVQFVCVNKEFRQRGVAKAMFEYAGKIYREENEELIFSSTEDGNQIMLGFFERNGWEKSGIIHNIQPQAEILFVKKLNQNELTFEPAHYKA
ncbi:MAG: GNAT family N-acetyltransferase [Ignavibacteria bacterium]|nr:GNAT family N-acetyltransferase [Ignavibacteria bacterium]